VSVLFVMRLWFMHEYTFYLLVLSRSQEKIMKNDLNNSDDYRPPQLNNSYGESSCNESELQ